MYDNNRLFWTRTDEAMHIHKQADATASSIKVSQTLMSTTLEEAEKDEDGNNEAEASDDNTDEEDDEIRPDDEVRANSVSATHKHTIVIDTVMSEDDELSKRDTSESQCIEDVRLNIISEHKTTTDTQVMEGGASINTIDAEVVEEHVESTPQYVTIAMSGLELE